MQLVVLAEIFTFLAEFSEILRHCVKVAVLQEICKLQNHEILLAPIFNTDMNNVAGQWITLQEGATRQWLQDSG